MANSISELPAGLRHSTSTGYAALLQVLDVIETIDTDSRSEFGKSITSARDRITGSLEIGGRVAALDAACKSTLLKIIAGPLADFFLDSCPTDKTGLAFKRVATDVMPAKPFISP